jgi:hypothetical protein
MKGCKYFPGAGGGYCRPTNTGIVEDNCVLYQDRCLIPAEYTKRTGQSPPPRLPQPAPPPPENMERPEVITQVRQGLQYISGPVSWYYFSVMGRKFHFFGDAHFSKNNNCPSFGFKCTTVTPRNEIIDLNQRCYDITYLLRFLFDRSKHDKTYTDFFLEMPFRSSTNPYTLDELSTALQKNVPLTTKQEETLASLDTNYIWTLFVVFNSCFQRSKEKCVYEPYVRFHYVDIRLVETPTGNEPITLNTYLFVNSILNILQMMQGYFILASAYSDQPQVQKLRQTIIEDVDALNMIIDRVLLRGRTLEGETVNYNAELFNAALNSKDYPIEVNRIFNLLLAGIPPNSSVYQDLRKLQDSMKTPVVSRKGQIIHRVQAQLEGLRSDQVMYHGHNMADLIETFIQDWYRESNLTQVYNNWRHFYTQVYLPFRKIVTSADLERVLVDYEKFRRTIDLGNYGNLISSDALLMDAYLLGRMFRRFTTPRPGRGVPVESTQVITYTGANHTKTYADFFTRVLQVKPIDSVVNPIEPKPIRCLRDPRFSQDFDI